MEQDDNFRFAEPRNRPRRDLFGHTGGVPVICFCCVISAARWMRPPANRTMKCCGSGNRDSGLPPRRERAKAEFIKENIDEIIFMFALFKCRKSDKGRN